MNRKQRKQRLKEMNNKVNPKKKSSSNLEKTNENADSTNLYPIKWQENLVNLIIFSLISLGIFSLEKIFNSKATSELVKALNEHSAPNSLAILLGLWVFFATIYKCICKNELEPKKLAYKLIFSPLNFSFNLAAVWIPISIISNFFNNTNIPCNEIGLILTAYIAIILLYNTVQYKESSNEMSYCGLFLLALFYLPFIGTLIHHLFFK